MDHFMFLNKLDTSMSSPIVIPQPCWFSVNKKSINSNDPVITRFRSCNMAGILNRVKMLGRPPAAVEAEDAAMVLPVDRQKKAIRNWRVVLDKIATILVMAALQEATGEWLPVSSPSVSSTEGIGDTPEDCFAEIIKIGKTFGTAEVEDEGGNYGSVRLRASQGHAGDGRQCGDVLCSVQDVSWKMGKSIPGKGRESGVQEGGFPEPQVNSGCPYGSGADAVKSRCSDWGNSEVKEQVRHLGCGGDPAGKPAESRDNEHGVPDSADGRSDGEKPTSVIKSKCVPDGGDAADEPGDEADDAAHEREGHSARSSGDYDGKSGAEGEFPEESFPTERGDVRDLQRCSSSITREREEQAGEVPMWSPGREVNGEEGGASTREAFLEVCATKLPVFRVGADREEHPRAAAQEEESEKKCGVRADIPVVDPSGGDRLGWAAVKDDGWQWCECSSDKSKSWARRAQMQGAGGLRGHGFEAARTYQVWHPDVGWSEEEGFIPKGQEGLIRVWVNMDSKSTCQDWFETLKQTSFTTKQRKKVFQALNLLGKKKSEDAEEEEYDERGPPPRPKKREEAERRLGGVVSEVYSPPRVASMAGRSKGLQQGSSFDLLNGWNLEDPEDVKEMWRVLRKEDPMLIVLCPPCTAFSRLQEWNFRKLGLEKSINILKLGLYHLDLVKEIAEWQVQKKNGLSLSNQKEQDLGMKRL